MAHSRSPWHGVKSLFIVPTENTLFINLYFRLHILLMLTTLNFTVNPV